MRWRRASGRSLPTNEHERSTSEHSSGISPDAWETIRRNRILLKAPITTPLGGGYKSLNVTIRKTLDLFADVRPSKPCAPFVASPHPGMNLVIIRENEEDLDAGIERQQTEEVTQVLELVARPGSERIIRYAFEYARAHGRRKVTCMIKDNIMKISDGLFHRVFEEVAAEYPDIESEHQSAIIARLGERPRQLVPVSYQAGGIKVASSPTLRRPKQLVGIDVFLDWAASPAPPTSWARRSKQRLPTAGA